DHRLRWRLVPKQEPTGAWREPRWRDPRRSRLGGRQAVSNKNKARRRAPASQASQAKTSQAKTSQARTSQGTAGQDGDISRALAELTGEGIYPPEWVTEIGKVTPGQAWRRYDVFGDDEAIAVTFSYGETEHGIVVQVDLAGLPVATTIGVSSDGAKLIEVI